MQQVAPTPAVSVLMPVHNGAAYVDEAIESVVRQTCVDWELIVVDDGSTDDTPEKLAAWARRDARIIVLSPGRLGLVGASNAAVSAARGRYLARLDSDDIAAPRALPVSLRTWSAIPRWWCLAAVSACSESDPVGCSLPDRLGLPRALAFRELFCALDRDDST